MSISLYMDHHVPGEITEGLMRRGIDVLTARDDNHAATKDPMILARATTLGRVLFTRDEDFLALGAERQRLGERFSGVIYAHQLRASIGDCVEELELICKVYEADDVENQVIHLRSR